VVLDKVPVDSERARIAKALGAGYAGGGEGGPDPELLRSADVVVDAAGAQHLLIQAVLLSRNNSVTAVLGSSTSPAFVDCDVEPLFEQLVQANKLVFGSVSASQQHLERAVDVLAEMDRTWPGVFDRAILRVPVADFRRGFEARARQVKVAICFSP
jgi:threonine dehydrogenase-like Zn-dependent dehydrogenase